MKVKHNLITISHSFYGIFYLGKVINNDSNLEESVMFSDFNYMGNKQIIISRLKKRLVEKSQMKQRGYISSNTNNFSIVFSKDAAGTIIHEILGHLLEFHEDDILSMLNQIIFLKQNLEKLKQKINLLDKPIFFPDDNHYDTHILIKNSNINSILCAENNKYLIDTFFKPINPIVQLRGQKKTPRTRFLEIEVSNLIDFPKGNTWVIEKLENAFVEGNSIQMQVLFGKFNNQITPRAIIKAKIADLFNKIIWINSQPDGELVHFCRKFDDVIPVGYLSPDIMLQDNIGIKIELID